MLFTSSSNPILAAFREQSDHSVKAAEWWLETLEDPIGPWNDEIHEAVSDALGAPVGPGWEDAYWLRTGQMYRHAIAVLNRFARIYG